ncbi:aldolase/citrate lyase family protein [Streptomyces sp. NPDC056656]|uniref:aldolase/citrate lyase family protein n=1 Tax=Streptomyces sp. NPDC056656 TaxID=3345895 RepID=UPI00368D6706
MSQLAHSRNRGRGPGYGLIDPVEYLASANADIRVIPLIEDAEGVDGIGEILAGGGGDMVLPGPGDRSQSYGVPWQTHDPKAQEAVRRVQAACVEHGVPFAAMCRTPEKQLGWRGVRTSGRSSSARNETWPPGLCATTWTACAGAPRCRHFVIA